MNGQPFEIPLLSEGLSALVDVLDTIDAKVLSQLRFVRAAGPSTLPTLGTLQEFVSALASSLIDEAAGYVPDLANLGDFFHYDAAANEITFTFTVREQVSASRNLALGFDLEAGLADLDFSTPAQVQAELTFDITVGIDLDGAFAGANPLDWFFLRDTSATGSISIAASDIDASARFGFL
ncbi:MAG: hypothetical protein N2544_18200, partial [Burkholderiales bacterium]|nr:hypothetical protein [Burkholderiales bacterium]